MRRIPARVAGLTASAFAVAMLALFPVAGHALSLCICADGEVTIEAECHPERCCEDAHALTADPDVQGSDDSSDCTEVPVLPDSETFNKIAAPAGKRVSGPVFAFAEFLARHSAPRLPLVTAPHQQFDSALADCRHSIRSTVLLI